MSKKLTILIAVLSLTNSICAALIPDMKFRRLDTRDGLSSSQVNCVFKDTRGFMWIGTPYGLNRYDGYRIKTFYANTRDTTSMRDNYVDQIFEAYDGRLWTKQGMNYCIYDPSTESFIRNVSQELAKMGIKGSVDYIYIDSRKNFWVKIADVGIYYYNPDSKRLHLFNNGYGPGEINPNYGIASMADLGNSVIFVSNNGEMVCLNGEKGWISWQSNWMKRHGGPENQEYMLRLDNKGNIYCRALGNTFIYLQQEHRWYKNLQELLRAHQVENVPDHQLLVWDVLVDRKNRIWAATDHDGLFVIDLKGKQLRQFQYNKYDQSSLSDNTIRYLYQDYVGRIWIGSYKNGVNEYRERKESIRSLELGDITTAREDRWGNYWLGTNDNGIIVYDPRTGETLQHYTTANTTMMGNIIVASLLASDSSFWFGTYNGGLIHCIPTSSGGSRGEATVVNYRALGEANQLANNSVWSVVEDRWHRIWMGLLGGGVQMFDHQKNLFRTWDSHNSILPGDYISSSSWTKKGWLLVGTNSYYSIVNPVTGKIINYDIPGAQDLSPTTASTVCVMEDSRGLIWQGSSSGAIVFDPANHNTYLLDMTKGLYGSSVCSITEDKQKTMWVVTDHGVSRIVPRQQEDRSWQFTVQTFSSADGLQEATFNQRSVSLTHDGLLLIGGQGGLDIINPDLISQLAISHERPVLSGLLLFEQPVDVGKKINGHVILEKALSMSEDLYLRHYENTFTIQLGSNASNVRNGKRFAYNIDDREGWIKTSEMNPNINFTSLRHGDYKLRVRMLNDDGTMGENETVLNIHVSSPIWRTRWAIILYALSLLIVGWWWRRRFLRRQEEQLRLEMLRRETEKQQWMSEMREQLKKEYAGNGSQQPIPEAGKDEALKIKPIVSDLIGFMRQTIEEFPMPADKKSRISFNTTEKSLNIAFDPEQLGRAMNILLSNSVNFTPSHCRIEVNVGKNEHHAIISLADNGIGIPEEARDTMFAPHVGKATGTSLYDVKRIAEAHGGSISVEHRKKGGTIFTIQLPVTLADQDIAIEEAVIIED